jgi:hypothetical protein
MLTQEPELLTVACAVGCFALGGVAMWLQQLPTLYRLARRNRWLEEQHGIDVARAHAAETRATILRGQLASLPRLIGRREESLAAVVDIAETIRERHEDWVARPDGDDDLPLLPTTPEADG